MNTAGDHSAAAPLLSTPPRDSGHNMAAFSSGGPALTPRWVGHSAAAPLLSTPPRDSGDNMAAFSSGGPALTPRWVTLIFHTNLAVEWLPCLTLASLGHCQDWLARCHTVCLGQPGLVGQVSHCVSGSARTGWPGVTQCDWVITRIGWPGVTLCVLVSQDWLARYHTV